MEIDTIAAAQHLQLPSRWRQFHDRLRADMIEAQCCLESGRLMRASEIIDGVLREARRTNKHLNMSERGRGPADPKKPVRMRQAAR